jgi:hypothetical protein
MRSPSEGSAAVDAILWLVCAPIGLKKRNIFDRGLAASLSTLGRHSFLEDRKPALTAISSLSFVSSWGRIDPVEVAVLMESMKIELRVGSKIDGFGQRIQFSLRAERAMICSREG